MTRWVALGFIQKEDYLAGSSSPIHPRSEGAQSASRAITLIQSVGKHNDHGAKVLEILSETGLHVATTHRILSVLASKGIFIFGQKSKRYRVGIELFVLCRIPKQFSIHAQLRSALENIANETDATVFLLTRSGKDVTCHPKSGSDFLRELA
jgi:DNA-binding IclR family transcriptional regulator